MPPRTKVSLGALLMLMSLTYGPIFISLLLFHDRTLEDRPFSRFLLGLAPWWMAYLSAKWYIRLAEEESPLYHPLGCLTQCCVWVLHWILSTYHAFFVTRFTFWTYLVTVFCAAVAVFQEGLFHSLITIGCKNTDYLGFYETLRRNYGKGLVFMVKLWYLADMGAPTALRETRNRAQAPPSRSMTM